MPLIFGSAAYNYKTIIKKKTNMNKNVYFAYEEESNGPIEMNNYFSRPMNDKITEKTKVYYEYYVMLKK